MRWLALLFALLGAAAGQESSWEEMASSSTKYISTRDRIACDVCVFQKTKDCQSYVPSLDAFSEAQKTRPPPETNLGRLVECKPSEVELWTTDGYFKVGDAQHPPTEQRAGCPDENRRPKYTGRLEKARQMCRITSKKCQSITAAKCADVKAGGNPPPGPPVRPTARRRSASVRRRARPTGPTESVDGIAGVYVDPNHLVKGVELAGLRMVASSGQIVGTDDGKSFFKLQGRLSADGGFEVDFRPKGGPASLTGNYANGKITWPDGNAWTKTSQA